MMPVTIEINGATILGRTRPASSQAPKAVEQFYGIRYAHAAQFQPAVAVPPQANDDDDPPPPPQDYLHLYITRPSNRSSSAPMPVVVFFHGGSFNFGHPLDSNVPSLVVQSEADIISVSVAYRLGPFGFGPGQEGDGEPHLNLGLWDQKLALDWIAQWVGAFGGDKNKVTVMGVSAGAHAIGHHMLDPTHPPAFHRAILESGSPTARSVLSAHHPRTLAQFQSFRDHLGGGDTSPDAVARAGQAVWEEGESSLRWPFQPVVEEGRGDALIPEIPLRLWERAELRVPGIITGFCSNEGVSFFPERPDVGLREFFQTLIPGLDLDALEMVYPPGGDEAARLVEAYSHHAYICPVFHTAHMASLQGRPAYVYEFAAANLPGGLVSHAAHDAVVRPPNDMRLGPGLEAVSQEMAQRWTRFISGDDIRYMWPVFDTPFQGGGRGDILVFGAGNDEMSGGQQRGEAVRTRTMTDRERQVCRFWWDNMRLTEGMGEP